MRFRLHPTVCRLGSNRHVNCIECHWWWWRDDMFPHQFRIPVPVLFINLFNSSASDFTIFKRISDGLYDSVSVSLHAKCLAGSVSYLGITCPVMNGASSLVVLFMVAHRTGLESKVYVLFCKSSFQLELEISGNNFAVNFNLWRLWWSGVGSASCLLHYQQQSNRRRTKYDKLFHCN